MAEMAETNFDEFKRKDCVFMADWLKTKGLDKLCCVFEGVYDRFISIFKYVNILKLFLQRIKNTFLGTITSRCLGNKLALLPRHHVRVGAFKQLFGPKNSNAWGGCPGGGDVEASI